MLKHLQKQWWLNSGPVHQRERHVNGFNLNLLDRRLHRDDCKLSMLDHYPPISWISSTRCGGYFTKPLRSVIFPISQNYQNTGSCITSRSYLKGVTADELNERSFSNPHPCVDYHFVNYRHPQMDHHLLLLGGKLNPRNNPIHFMAVSVISTVHWVPATFRLEAETTSPSFITFFKSANSMSMTIVCILMTVNCVIIIFILMTETDYAWPPYVAIPWVASWISVTITWAFPTFQVETAWPSFIFLWLQTEPLWQPSPSPWLSVESPLPPSTTWWLSVESPLPSSTTWCPLMESPLPSPVTWWLSIEPPLSLSTTWCPSMESPLPPYTTWWLSAESPLPSSHLQLGICQLNLYYRHRHLDGCQLNLRYHNIYRKISNIRRTKSQNLNVSRLGLQLSLCNILKPSVKWRMKM